VDHHFAGLRRLVGDTDAGTILGVLDSGIESPPIDARAIAAIGYATRLTHDPGSIREQDVVTLRDAGFDDGEILEINQVVSYFAYANRTVLGLGVDTQGDLLGLSPGKSADPADWSHA
jgi:alkylhydroperoxidase family enzyme